MPELQPIRLPHARFESVVIETKDANGHPVYTDRYMAYVTPIGGKDEAVKIAEEWIADLGKKASDHFGAPTEYATWYDHFSKQFEAFKQGHELSCTGTPLRVCMAFSGSEIKRCELIHVFSLEDLASLNEEGLGRLGMGGRNLKIKAQEILANNKTTKPAEEIAALRQKVTDLEQLVQDMIAAGHEKPVDPEIKKAGRPKRAA